MQRGGRLVGAADAVRGQVEEKQEEEDDDGIEDPRTGIVSKRVPQVCAALQEA